MFIYAVLPQTLRAEKQSNLIALQIAQEEFGAACRTSHATPPPPRALLVAGNRARVYCLHAQILAKVAVKPPPIKTIFTVTNKSQERERERVKRRERVEKMSKCELAKLLAKDFCVQTTATGFFSTKFPLGSEFFCLLTKTILQL